MAKRNPSEAQDSAGAAARPRKPRSQSESPRDVHYEATPPAPSEPLTSEPGTDPTDEDIRLRAYHRYLERGGGHGMDFEDWLEAERELKLKR
jgi:DUF2934 family protein